MTASVDQIEFWNGEVGAAWVRHQDNIDQMIQPLGQSVLAAAAIKPGETVLDIGCGCGATTIEIAQRIGSLGSVTGIDISKAMLSRASSRAASVSNGASIKFKRSDVARRKFKKRSFDLAFSRFGVMFFPDPMKAFRNIRRALKPGGRLAFVCWQDMKKSQFFAVPALAASPFLEAVEEADPRAPGPFAFADRDYVENILSESGFIDIRLTQQIIGITIPDSGGPMPTADFLLGISPTPGAPTDNPRTLKKIQRAVANAFRDHYGPFGPVLETSTWLVTAHR